MKNFHLELPLINNTIIMNQTLMKSKFLPKDNKSDYKLDYQGTNELSKKKNKFKKTLCIFGGK